MFDFRYLKLLVSNNKLYTGILLLGFSIFFLIRFKYHFSALETDTGYYGYGAQEILRGNLPYEAFHFNKPPGVLYIYAIAFRFFGDNFLVIKKLATVFLFLGALFLYLLSRLVYSKNFSLGVLLFYLLAISLPYIQTIHANTEVFMVTFLIISSFLMLKKDIKGYLIFSGISLGIAFLFKPVAVANWLAFVVWLYLVDRKRFVEKSLVLSFSAALPFLFIVFYFLQKGILDEFWFSLVRFNSAYMNTIPFLLRPFFINTLVLLENPAVWIFGLIGAVYSILKLDRRATLFGLQALFPFLLIIYSGKNWGHYYFQVVPFLTVTSVYSFSIRNQPWRRVSILFFAILICYSVFRLFRFVVFTPVGNLITVARPGERGDWYDQSIYVADYIKNFVKPGDFIYNLGREDQIYFYTRTRSPSRFLDDRVFFYFPETLKETCEDLAANKPKLIVNTLKEPYFSERWSKYLWGELKKCGDLKVTKKEKVLFAEIWFIE